MATRSRAVLITGCSTGIGRATALHMAGKGWNVYATARRLESIADLEAAGCHILPLDVTDEQSMVAAVDAVSSAEGAIGVLVNNAGYALEGAIEELPLDAVRRQFETNVFGLLRLTQLVLPGMRAQRWGRVINISSIGGKLTLPGGGAYHASKHAVEALSDALRFEARGFGVKVVVIEPGWIMTEWGKTARESMTADGHHGPYAHFNASVDDNLRRAYSRPLSLLARGPDSVATVIERAARAKRPRTRYVTAPSGHLFLAMRRWLPDRLWDAGMRVGYKTPK